MGEFRMPSLGADMEAGTLVAFRVPVGGRIEKGEILAEVETEKGIIEVESFEEGTIERYLVEPGRKVPVGTPLAVIGGAEAPSPTATATPSPTPTTTPTPIATPTPSAESTPVTETAYGAAARISAGDFGTLASPALRRRARELGIALEDISGTGPHGRLTLGDFVTPVEPVEVAPGPPAVPAGDTTAPRVRISPLARSRAEELGVGLDALSGSGPGGSIVLRDVEEAAERAARAETSIAPRTPAERMQHAIAEAMSRANREIPHYYLSETIDLAEALRFLARHNENAAVESRIVPGLLFVRAVARAVKKVRGLNGFRREGRTEISDSAHVGVAISLRGGGLVAPALFDADHGTLDDLMRRFTDLVTRAKQGSLRSSEMTGATITVTSLGERGVESVLPIIFPPQVAMVGFGTVVERPWAVSGQVVVRPVVTTTLAGDHRITNGHVGARFLATVAQQLNNPEAL